jgi:hypothetical protein
MGILKSIALRFKIHSTGIWLPSLAESEPISFRAMVITGSFLIMYCLSRKNPRYQTGAWESRLDLKRG